MGIAFLNNFKHGTVLLIIFVLDLTLQSYFRFLGFGIANEGVSFGFFPGLGRYISILVYLLLVALSIKNKDTGKFWVWLILVGGLGNLIPRLLYGSVWDYLFFHPLPFWFNLSDVFITGGVLFFLIGEVFTLRSR